MPTQIFHLTGDDTAPAVEVEVSDVSLNALQAALAEQYSIVKPEGALGSAGVGELLTKHRRNRFSMQRKGALVRRRHQGGHH